LNKWESDIGEKKSKKYFSTFAQIAKGAFLVPQYDKKVPATKVTKRGRVSKRLKRERFTVTPTPGDR